MAEEKTFLLWASYSVICVANKTGLGGNMAEPDYYDLLGVAKGATLQEIRAEFRNLAFCPLLMNMYWMDPVTLELKRRGWSWVAEVFET